MLHDGDLVELHFHGTLDDGTVFDSSRGRRARMFVLGRGQMIPAFEERLRSLSPGESARFTISSDEAYGPHEPSLVFEAPRDEAPEGVQPGDMVQLSGGRPGAIVAVGEQSVTVDGNHPLAGQALHFEVEIVSARAAVG